MLYRTFSSAALLPVLIAFGFLLAENSFALEPEQIALVVNTKVPEGRKLAEFYASKRHIPDNRIIELALSTNSDDINPAEYDEKVVPVVREFLTKNNLENQVTCLVTFWGVPLRVDGRSLSGEDKKELADLKDEAEDLRAHIEQQVKAAETLAHSLNAEAQPGTGVEIDDLAKRAETALNSTLRSIEKMPASPERDQAYTKMTDLARDLIGPAPVAEKNAQPDVARVAPKPPTTEEAISAHSHITEVGRQIGAIQSQPQTSETRAKLREIFKTELGDVNLARLLTAQIRFMDNKESESAFDSELALLWWPAYPKSRWTINPLDWHYSGHHELPQHTLMVMRLDGPTEQSVHDLIETSLKIEAEGLKGEVVLDARGKPPTEPYGVYDQTIRNLADLLHGKAPSLKVVLDNKDSLIPKDSEHDIAIYCGWYSLRNYVSPGTFVPGAVGYHVASGEMVSLHNANERGWCRNLMSAGVVSTLGPVAEPYLQSFPPADEYFPLLMTGKLPLAEVYWKTTPWTSWMQCCVGDPLYCPYKVNPPLKPEDLSEGLRRLVSP